MTQDDLAGGISDEEKIDPGSIKVTGGEHVVAGEAHNFGALCFGPGEVPHPDTFGHVTHLFRLASPGGRFAFWLSPGGDDLGQRQQTRFWVQ